MIKRTDLAVEIENEPTKLHFRPRVEWEVYTEMQRYVIKLVSDWGRGGGSGWQKHYSVKTVYTHKGYLTPPPPLRPPATPGVMSRLLNSIQARDAKDSCLRTVDFSVILSQQTLYVLGK